MTCTVKRCTICKELKTLNDYSPAKEMRDGKASECKACHAERNRQYRKNNTQSSRESGKKWRDKNKDHCCKMRIKWCKNNRQKEIERTNRYMEKYPEKKRAVMDVRNAIRRGDMVRLPCEVCGLKRSHGHHDDYSRPLEVKWFCALHHKVYHMKLHQEGIEL
jgi:hypothetical protein